jgi:protein-L-isoaspartate(D-aspartate) O-methyltransferase
MVADRGSRIRRRRFFAALFPLLLLAMGASLSSTGGLACRDRENPSRQEKQEPAAGLDLRGSTRFRRSHPAFGERVSERTQMVRRQIEAREVRDPKVLEAMQIVPRHAFVPAAQRAYAYEDGPLPIGYGQTISQPYIVAFMTEALQLDPNSVVLEIGTGSSYQAAVCAEIAREVYTIEIVEPLARSATELLARLGYGNVHVRAGDGYGGWPEEGPFDAIIGTAAAEKVPPPLIEQLKNGGRMILPVVGDDGFQYLILLTKDHHGQVQRKNVLPVRFVPMTGRVQQPSHVPDGGGIRAIDR